MTSIKDDLLDDLKPFLAKTALKYFSQIEEYVLTECKKTSTPFDDFVANQILSWVKGRLQAFIK